MHWSGAPDTRVAKPRAAFYKREGLNSADIIENVARKLRSLRTLLSALGRRSAAESDNFPQCLHTKWALKVATGAGAQIAFAMREDWRETRAAPAALLQPMHPTFAPLLWWWCLFVLTRVRRTNSLRRRFASEATREMNLHRKRRQQRETGDFAAEEINCWLSFPRFCRGL